MTHGLALGSGEAGNITDDGLGHVRLDEVSSTLFSVSTDLTNHDDDLGLRVSLERSKGVDVRGSDDGVTTDSDCG